MKYLSEIINYWYNHFKISKLSVYDYINNIGTSAEFGKLISTI